MHLLVRETRSLDETAPAVDLAHGQADLVVLSFSDADLGALASVDSPSLRLAPLGKLRHPMSVDLYLEQTVAHARCVVLRLLGGLDYWRYGTEELVALCQQRAIPLAVLPGDGRADPALAALSTVSAEVHARLDGYFRHSGVANMRRAVGLMTHLAGLGADDGQAAEALPQHAVHALDLDDRDLAAIVFYRSHLMSDDIAPVMALMGALRSRGLAVGAIYAGSLKAPDTAAFVARTLAAWRPAVVLNATGFSARALISPANEERHPPSRGAGDEGSPLDAADAPVLQLILAGTQRTAWQSSTRGLTPADLAMQVVLPELDGRLLTTAISFKREQDGRTIHDPDLDGIALAADRAAGWAWLRRIPAADRRVAIVLSDYPGLGGQRGHAVGLDSFASLAAITGLLAEHGYATRAASCAELTTALSHAEPTPFLSLTDYAPLFATLPQILQDAATAAWGDPASDPSVLGSHFTLRHCKLGSVAAYLQPDRGDRGDRRAAYHDADLPPRHGFIAFYLSLRTRHALVHLGTHGSLEWLPGKATALSAICWPLALIGGLPVIYPFIVNNPGEAAAAKRRLGAITIGHLTPPIRSAGLQGEAASLEHMIDEYAAADGMDRRRTAMLRRGILDRAAASGLLDESGIAPDAPDDDALARLDAYLCDVKDLQIRDGLHVYGKAPDAGRLAMLPPGADACAAAERTALLAALDGRFVAPGPAGAPSASRADVLPTGRNLAGLDPRMLPTRSALALAERAATDLLRRHRQDHGDWPRSVVLNVWGTSAMRTGGEDIALALLLLGVLPVWDEGSGRVNGFTVTPIAELDRPRVDVTLRISGLFRDAFAAQVALFAAAAAAVAGRDEAADWNPLAGRPGERVFGPAPGQYGVGRDWLAASVTGYGAQADGMADRASLEQRVRDADALLHVQDHAGTDLLDGPEYAAHLGGFASAASALGADPALYYHDGQARTVAEQVARVVRGRAANPVWLAGMMRHGYSGAAEIARAVDALGAFAATLPQRFDRQFDLLYAALEAPDVDAFLRRENPEARAAIADRFARARQGGHWHPRRNDLAA
jgi:cobaltochelatase CobN